MGETTLEDELLRAEALLIQGEDELARDLLLRLAEDAEEYVDRNCPTTDTVQWFSFPTLFERLCYRRVENDPRELHEVGEPLDRLYADLALADVRLGDYELACEALKRAVRWNPMECGYRLDLADLYLVKGDVRECLALAYSVFERASEATHLARAYVTFANWFERSGNARSAAACLRAAERLGVRDSTVEAALAQARETACDPAMIDDEEANAALASEGLPDGANVEVAICLLMCAGDAARVGQRELAVNLTLRARDLVGEATAASLLALIHEEDGDEG